MKRKYALVKLKNQLKTICKNPSYVNEQDYNNIKKVCQDFEFEYGDDLKLCNHIEGEEIVTEDDVIENLLPNNSDSLARLRCFINSTYDDSIYRIDGYGNLDNVTTDFLSIMCEDLTTIIDKEINSLNQDEEL